MEETECFLSHAPDVEETIGRMDLPKESRRSCGFAQKTYADGGSRKCDYNLNYTDSCDGNTVGSVSWSCPWRKFQDCGPGVPANKSMKVLCARCRPS